jgi:hypothetical protein
MKFFDFIRTFLVGSLIMLMAYLASLNEKEIERNNSESIIDEEFFDVLDDKNLMTHLKQKQHEEEGRDILSIQNHDIVGDTLPVCKCNITRHFQTEHQ